MTQGERNLTKIQHLNALMMRSSRKYYENIIRYSASITGSF